MYGGSWLVSMANRLDQGHSPWHAIGISPPVPDTNPNHSAVDSGGPVVPPSVPLLYLHERLDEMLFCN